MNDESAKQLIRQLKIMNVWITLFGSLLVVGLIVMAILLFQLIGFIQDTNDKIESVKTQTSDSLNLKKQVCEGEGGISGFFKESTEVCQ